jgi:hypothetical protein
MDEYNGRYNVKAAKVNHDTLHGRGKIPKLRVHRQSYLQAPMHVVGDDDDNDDH